MPIFDCRGHPLHYLARGSGEAVLMIHGLGSSGADWAFQVPALEPHFHVIAPDLPDCGHSPRLEAGCSVRVWAESLWALLDGLGSVRPNIVGFSLGGAVGIEMALQRPASVPRLALINSLATYRVDHWTKWCKARIDAGLARLIGMRRTAELIAARLFPDPHQEPMRARAQAVIGAVPAKTYLEMAAALERWSAIERLDALQCRTLLIAAEHDYTPLAEKRSLAARLRTDLIVVRGSRHGTPFDSIRITNAGLLAFLTDQPLPPQADWVRDDPLHPLPYDPANSLATEHAAFGMRARTADNSLDNGCLSNIMALEVSRCPTHRATTSPRTSPPTASDN
jgi:pimeloyl-ACP methyl ester carboxylesterase